MRTPTLAVRVQLPLGWNTNLLFNSDIVNFVWKTDEEEAESIILLIFDIWRCFNCRWVRGGGVCQKVLFRASWNRTFFQPWFQQKQYVSMKHFELLYRLDISTFYFTAIAVSAWKFIKCLSLSTISLTVNSHVDNHFCKCTYLLQMLYNMKTVCFLLKCSFRIFIFRFDFNVK